MITLTAKQEQALRYGEWPIDPDGLVAVIPTSESGWGTDGSVIGGRPITVGYAGPVQWVPAHSFWPSSIDPGPRAAGYVGWMACDLQMKGDD